MNKDAKDEPVAFKDSNGNTRMTIDASAPVVMVPHPAFQQRTWVGLTYEDMVALQKDLYNAKGESVLPTTFAMAVEAKLKEKNT